MEQVKKEMPIEQCKMTAAWKSRGWASDCIQVATLPAVSAQKTFYQARPRDVLHEVLNSEVDAFADRLAQHAAARVDPAPILPAALAPPPVTRPLTAAAAVAAAQPTKAPSEAARALHLVTQSSHFARARHAAGAAPADLNSAILSAVRTNRKVASNRLQQSRRASSPLASTPRPPLPPPPPPPLAGPAVSGGITPRTLVADVADEEARNEASAAARLAAVGDARRAESAQAAHATAVRVFGRSPRVDTGAVATFLTAFVREFPFVHLVSSDVLLTLKEQIARTSELLVATPTVQLAGL